MTTRRRDILKAAAAATLAAPFAVTPERAAALLNAPAELSGPLARTGPVSDIDELDVIDFAQTHDSFDSRLGAAHGAAEDFAAYKHAYHRVLDHLQVDTRALAFNHPLIKLDEAATDLWTAAWMAGVRAGAAYEHLRQAIVPARLTCRTCDGSGRTWNGHWYRDDAYPAVVCTECGGAGHVPTPAAKLPALTE